MIKYQNNKRGGGNKGHTAEEIHTSMINEAHPHYLVLTRVSSMPHGSCLAIAYSHAHLLSRILPLGSWVRDDHCPLLHWSIPWTHLWCYPPYLPIKPLSSLQATIPHQDEDAPPSHPACDLTSLSLSRTGPCFDSDPDT